MSYNLIIRQYDWLADSEVDFTYPEGREVSVYSQPMLHDCQCATCGRLITKWQTYPSTYLYSPFGFPVCVCLECFTEETLRRQSDWVAARVDR